MRIEAFLHQSPAFQASRAARSLDASLTLALENEEVTPFEALILAAIFFERRGDVKPSALAEAFETTRGNISHSISALEARNLVERRIDPDDARAVRLLLTPLGRRRAVRVVGILDRIQRSLEAAFGPTDLEATLRSINSISELCSQLCAHAPRAK